MKHDIILPVGGNQVVHDESQFSGTAFSVSYPETVQDVSDIVRTCAQSGESITVHGSLTALNGAGVPLYGHCMDMQRLSQVTYDPQDQTVWAQAGASFQSIEQTVRRESHMTREFPASPTEKTATLGGGLSFHTAGLRSFRYGSVADHVLELEYCNNKGEIRRLTRGQDGFDLFLGSEGMCGVITGARLSTVPLLPHVWGLIFFFDDDDTAIDFAARAEGLDCVSVLEYMDSACFRLADEYRDSLSASRAFPPPRTITPPSIWSWKATRRRPSSRPPRSFSVRPRNWGPIRTKPGVPRGMRWSSSAGCTTPLPSAST